MVKAVFGDVVVADSNDTIVIEGNHYFPPGDVRKDEYLGDSTTSTVCPWKGTASYYNANVNGKQINDVAWRVRDSRSDTEKVLMHDHRYYPAPKEKAASIKDYVAFYKNKVKIA